MIAAALSVACVLLGLVGLWVVVGLSPAIALALPMGVIAVAFLSHRLWARRLGPSLVPRLAASSLAGLIVVGIAIQAVPYGRAHDNPPITAEPAWDSAMTRDLAVRACFDCHSNEVRYPWYANVAPFSWAVQQHVDQGRRQVNYSEWDRPQHEAEESAETVRDGSMPPSYYLLTHSDARLTDEEKRLLVAGLAATIGDDDHGDGGGGDEDEYYEDDEGSSEVDD